MALAQLFLLAAVAQTASGLGVSIGGPSEPESGALLPVQVTGAAPGRVRGSVSAGTLEQRTDGRFELRLPTGRAPRALVLVITDETRSAAAFLPVPGHTTLPVETRPNVQVHVRVADRVHGPYNSGRGRIAVPLVVPPGVRTGTVVAVDRLGNERHARIDLKTPDLPRLAAVVANSKVGALLETRVAIAWASPRGARGRGAVPTVTAARGTVDRIQPIAPGLFVARYRAPTALGADELRIEISGDPKAGRVTLPIEVLPGPPAQIEIELAEQGLVAGASVSGRLRVRDAAGHLLTGPVSAKFGDTKVEVASAADGHTFTLQAPEQLPEERNLSFAIVAGDFLRVKPVVLRAGTPARAFVDSSPRSRRAEVRVRAEDSFGNEVEAENAFAVVADGASTATASWEGRRQRLVLAADRNARRVRVSVNVGSDSLATTEIRFDPPPHAFLLGAWARGGWAATSGELSTPRAGLGIAVRRGLGPFELSVGLGIEGARSARTVSYQGETGFVNMDQRLELLAFPVTGRLTLPLGYWAGVSAGGSFLPMYVRTELDPGYVATTRADALVTGARAELGVFVRLGPGRVVGTAGYGDARLAEGPVVGRLEEWSAQLGYEWWWADLGP